MQNITKYDTQAQALTQTPTLTLTQEQAQSHDGQAKNSTKKHARFTLPGFSMFEMMLVIGVIAFLFAFLMPRINRSRLESSIRQTKLKLKALQGSIESYHGDTDQYPSSLNDLIKKPANVQGWISPYIPEKKHPVDEWKNKLGYEVTPEGSEHPYELYSYGPKGKKTPKKDRISAWSK